MRNVIEINNLYKEYKLGVIGRGTLYRDLQSFWAKLMKKEDPNSMIGKTEKNFYKKNVLAINDLSLNIKEGEIFGLIGANGAGKSTLLKILSRITSPTKGTIKIKGKVASLLEVGTGFHPELTGKENIYLNGAINGMSTFETRKKLDEIINFSGVEEFIDTPIKRYSSGMLVRLGFSVAAHLGHDILAIDEILAVGDLEFREKAVGKVKELKNTTGRTIIFVSHNMQSISQICSRVGLVENGKLIGEGNPSDMILKYNQILETYDLNNDDLNYDKKFRRGNGKAKFKSVIITDINGNKKIDFNKNEKIVIKFHYEVYQDVKDLICKLAFRSNSGEVVAGYSSFFVSRKSLKKGTSGSGKFIIETNSMMRNTFRPLIWLGESSFQSETDIVDGLVPPFIINDNNEKEKVGYFKPKVTFE